MSFITGAGLYDIIWFFGPQLGHYQIDDVISGHKTDSCPQLYCVAVKHIVLVSSDCDRVREVKFDLSSDLIHFAYSASLDHKPLNTPCVFHWAQIITIIIMKNPICKKKDNRRELK